MLYCSKNFIYLSKKELMKICNEHKEHPEGIEVALEIMKGIPKLLLEQFIDKYIISHKDVDINILWNRVVDNWFEKYIFKTGDIVRGFDSNEWSKTGDIGNNNQFWHKATVIKTRRDKHGRPLADIKFEDGTISNGHFQYALEKM